MDPKSLEEALEDARRARQEALSLSLDLEALAGQMKSGRSLDEQAQPPGDAESPDGGRQPATVKPIPISPRSRPLRAFRRHCSPRRPVADANHLPRLS